MDYNEILDFGDGPATSVDEKLAILKFNYSWAEEMERHDREMEEAAAHLNPALCDEGATKSRKEMFKEKIDQSKENQGSIYMDLENEESKKENLANSGEDSGNSSGQNIDETVTDKDLKKNPEDVGMLEKMNLESNKRTVLEWHDQIMENVKLRRDTTTRHNNFLEKDVLQMASKPLELVENKYEGRLPKIEEEIYSETLTELPSYENNKIQDTIPNPFANSHKNFQERDVFQMPSKTLGLVENKYVQRLSMIEEEILPETPNESPTYLNTEIQNLIPNVQEEKQVSYKMRSDVAEQCAKKEGQGNQENLGDGPESHLKDVGREAQSEKTKDGGYHQDEERIQIMERLRTQLSLRNVKRRRRRRKNGAKTKVERTKDQDEVTVKGELGFGETHGGIDEDVEKLTQNQDAPKQINHQTEEDKQNTTEVEVDVVSAVTMNSTADVADDNEEDDDDDGFMPRRLFFFSFSQFKIDERTSY